jgi:3D (Asp-Asp-Asp) domain-containing protein
MRNRTMCLSMVLLSSSLLFTMPTNTKTPLANNIKEEANVKETMHKDKFGLLINPIFEKLEKDKIEFEQKKTEEERLKKEKQLEAQKKNDIAEFKEFELTFYSSLNCENGFGAITSTGHKLFDGVVASNHYKINTKIKLQGWGEVVVLDRGSDKYFNNDYRLDVYIPREQGESDSAYFKRVNKMGKMKVKGYIVK